MSTLSIGAMNDVVRSSQPSNAYLSCSTAKNVKVRANDLRSSLELFRNRSLFATKVNKAVL